MKVGSRLCVLLLAAVLCAGMAPAAFAASYDSVDKLFFDGLNDKEKYARVRIEQEDDEIYDEDDWESLYEEIPVIVRSTKSSISVKKDVKVFKELSLTVAKNTTMTIEKGVTVTVTGDLVVLGTLINKGTLIVGQKAEPDDELNFSSDELKDIAKFMTMRNVDVKGTFTNEGTVTILNGTLRNRVGGKLNNKGKITVSNTAYDSAGLINYALKKGDSYTFGTAVNDGTIYVRNTRGNGIHNYGGGKFTNNGKIYLGAKGKIKGTISGAKPVKE